MTSKVVTVWKNQIPLNFQLELYVNLVLDMWKTRLRPGETRSQCIDSQPKQGLREEVMYCLENDKDDWSENVESTKLKRVK